MSTTHYDLFPPTLHSTFPFSLHHTNSTRYFSEQVPSSSSSSSSSSTSSTSASSPFFTPSQLVNSISYPSNLQPFTESNDPPFESISSLNALDTSSSSSTLGKPLYLPSTSSSLLAQVQSSTYPFYAVSPSPAPSTSSVSTSSTPTFLEHDHTYTTPASLGISSIPSSIPSYHPTTYSSNSLASSVFLPSHAYHPPPPSSSYDYLTSSTPNDIASTHLSSSIPNIKKDIYQPSPSSSPTLSPFSTSFSISSVALNSKLQRKVPASWNRSSSNSSSLPAYSLSPSSSSSFSSYSSSSLLPSTLSPSILSPPCYPSTHVTSSSFYASPSPPPSRKLSPHTTSPSKFVLKLKNGIEIYVNPKQFKRILKRRLARAKGMELQVTFSSSPSPSSISSSSSSSSSKKRPYLHESRHKHAMRRPRGPDGRFLTKAELAALKMNADNESSE